MDICKGHNRQSRTEKQSRHVNIHYENIFIIDAKGAAAAAAAEKLLVKRACELRDAGELSAPQIAADLEQFRSRIRLYACLDTLEYLARGGRLPKSIATVGNAIKLKPIVSFSEEGGKFMC